METNIKTISIAYQTYSNYEALPEDLKELYTSAKDACDTAYAPYSNFHVGAAVRLGNGEIITGSNQENAAYPSGLCAERTAFFHIGSSYEDNIESVAVAARLKDANEYKENISPCGSCRQVMSEYETKQNKTIRFLMPGKNGEFIVFESVSHLLPFLFDSRQLQ